MTQASLPPTPAPPAGDSRPRKRRRVAAWALIATVLIAVAAAIALRGRGGDPDPAWADEFTGVAGSRPADHWKLLEGGGGWGNAEWQVYRSDPANVSLDGRGNLRIRAQREPDGQYTSARLESKVAFTYGTFEARINAPAGRGLWSAFWTLAQNHERIGWPRGGEIDIVELLNEHEVANVNVHVADRSAPDGRWQSPGRHPLSPGWHVYGLRWSPDRLVFLLDGTPFHEVARSELERDGRQWPFDRPQVLLLNLAVGGNWPGPPDDSTRFPADLLVDYVRVYAR